MASVASQLIEEVTAHAQSESFEDALEIWDLIPMNDENGNGTNQSLWTEAVRNLQMARKKVAQRYNEGRKEHHCGVGDSVRCQLKLSSSKAQNVTAKLILSSSAPVVVAKVLRPDVVLLASPDTGVIIRRAHIRQLKPCVK